VKWPRLGELADRIEPCLYDVVHLSLPKLPFGVAQLSVGADRSKPCQAPRILPVLLICAGISRRANIRRYPRNDSRYKDHVP
jgi:hypothetical protein